LGFEVRLPQLGFSMEEGTLQEWLVSNGAQVEKGVPLYSLEADKAVEEIEAPASGQLRILVDGGTHPVGSLLAVIE
jgi:pyruvate/2-oxoglutarate dehydrogenase complex dihydrolipoamide acyltransferase (E2) component